jgi:cyclophilin family peptidyl-prolyl cis-trans isomerase
MSDKRQRQKELRAAKKEEERKQEARKELGRRLLTAFGFGAVVVGVFAATAIFSNEGEIPSGYEAYRAQETACGAEQPPPETVMTFEGAEAQADLENATSATATLETSCGPIEIELDLDYPATVNSFVFLAREGYYDGQAIHRIFDGFVIQGGDPAADGTSGPGYRVVDEYPPDDFIYEEGVVAMANRGRGTTGSQFFMVIGDASSLNPQFNVLGRVISGTDTLDRMAEVDTAQQSGSVENSRPLQTVYIESVEIDITGS